MATYVLVHGAGTGGWLWDGVAERLRDAGNVVYAPSLRGVGELMRDDDRGVALSTHITEIVEHVEREDLQRAVLVGFSYGGLVITGAAGRLGSRVARLVYVDAFLPQPGRTFLDLLPEPARIALRAAAEARGEGWRIPPAPLEMVGGVGATEPGVSREQVITVLQRRGAHPMGTYTEPFPSIPPEVADLPSIFVSCTDKPAGDPLVALAARLRASGRAVEELPTGHFAMLSMPTRLVELIRREPVRPG